MKVRNVMQIVPFLLIVALPTTGTIPDGNGPDADVEPDHELGEGSTGGVHSHADFGFLEATEAASQLREYQVVQDEGCTHVRAAFLSPSYFLESIQTTPASTAPDPSPPNFWEAAKEFKKDFQSYVHRLLEGTAKYFNSAKLIEITSTMNQIVRVTSTFRDNIKGALDEHQVTFDMLSDELKTIFMGIVNDLEIIPRPDKAIGHAERAEMVDKDLDDTTRELVKLGARYEIEEEVVSTYIHTLKPHVLVLAVAVGDMLKSPPYSYFVSLSCPSHDPECSGLYWACLVSDLLVLLEVRPPPGCKDILGGQQSNLVAGLHGFEQPEWASCPFRMGCGS